VSTALPYLLALKPEVDNRMVMVQSISRKNATLYIISPIGSNEMRNFRQICYLL